MLIQTEDGHLDPSQMELIQIYRYMNMVILEQG